MKKQFDILGIFSADGKKKVKVGKLIRISPGGRHAFYESSVGPIRKPYPLDRLEKKREKKLSRS